MRIFMKNKAQSTAEYVIVLGLIVGAVIAMQTYVKRGMQGRIKNAADYVDNSAEQLTGAEVVPQFEAGQYEPYYLKSQFDTERKSYTQEKLNKDLSVNRTLTADETVTQKAGGYRSTLTTTATEDTAGQQEGGE